MRIKFIISFLFLVFILSCSKDKCQFLELTSGRAMDPSQGRFGVKVMSDNYFYVCKEVMNVDSDKYYNHTGKYRYYKSASKIDFLEYQALITTNFSKDKRVAFHAIPDECAYQIHYNFNTDKDKYRFYRFHLNEKQSFIFGMLDSLRYKKFKEIGSIEFSSDLLQERLPEPPKL